MSYHLALLFRLVLGRYSLTEDVTALDQLRSKVDQLLSHATAMLRENGNIQEEVKNLERILLLFEANCYTEEQKQEIDRTALNAVSRKQVKIAKCYYYKYTLFVRIVRQWNKLPRYIVEAGNLRRFKANRKSYVYFIMSYSFKIGHAKSVRFRFESQHGDSVGESC